MHIILHVASAIESNYTYRKLQPQFHGETISKIFEHDKFAKLKDIVIDLYEKREPGYQRLATLGYTFTLIDEVKTPMYYVFNHVYKLFIAPLELNRNTLKHICEERPPIKTLQVRFF
uniref:Uncharacterized protein n=1 Tax=Panagrolaimus davidi TaxID=227884 RepID=A0A914QRR6_9BILA